MMKIIIVGAGVSGLATYLQLRKTLPSPDSHTIRIYESHQLSLETNQSSHSYPSVSAKLGDDLTDSTAVVGNTIALAPNSVRLLKDISPKLYKNFKSRGYVNHTYKFRTARGHTLAVTTTGDKRLPEEHTISCPRHNLWKCLHEVVGEDKIAYRKVIHVDLNGAKPVVRLADGRAEDADLVIGADGARSVVKRAIFGKDDEGLYAPCYEYVTRSAYPHSPAPTPYPHLTFTTSRHKKTSLKDSGIGVSPASAPSLPPHLFPYPSTTTKA